MWPRFFKIAVSRLSLLPCLLLAAAAAAAAAVVPATGGHQSMLPADTVAATHQLVPFRQDSPTHASTP